MLVCPNKNDRNWKEMVSAIGETNAYRVFIENGYEIPQYNPEIHKVDKREFYASLGYEHTVSAAADVVDFDNMKWYADQLSERTGLKYTLNPELDAVGRFGVDGIEFNPNYHTRDAIFHEFLHPFVSTMFVENEALFENIEKEMNDSVVGNMVREMVNEYYNVDKMPQAMYRQELVTTYLGILAANRTVDMEVAKQTQNIFEKAWEYIKALFDRWFGDNNPIVAAELAPDTPISKLVDELFTTSRKIDVSYHSRVVNNLRQALIDDKIIDTNNNILSALKLLEVNKQLAEAGYAGVIKITGKGLFGGKVSFRSFEKKASDQFNKDKFKKNTANGDEYTNKKGDKIKSVGKGLREMSVNDKVREMTEMEYLEHLAEMSATNQFKSQGILNPTDKSVDSSGKTYAQVVAEKKASLKLGRIRGTAHHLAMQAIFEQAALTPDQKKIEELLTQIAVLGQMSMYNRLLRNYSDKDGNIQMHKLQEDLDMNEDDIVESEVIVSNKELGYAGTMDVFIEHANGFYSIKDIKTGSSLGNNESPYFFEGTNVRMTALNMAKLQIAMYAMLIKSNNRDAKFRRLQVVQQTTTGNVSTKYIDVDLYEMLPIVKAKLIREGKRQFVDDNPHLFIPSEYTGLDIEAETAAEFSKMSTQQIKEYLISRMKKVLGVKSLSSASSMSKQQASRLKQLLQTYMDFMGTKRFNLDDMKDMDALYRSMGDMLNVSNERLQAFSQVYYTGFHNYQEEMHKIIMEHERLLRAVLKEQGRSGLDIVGSFFQKEDPKKFLGFMWIQDGDVWRFVDERKDGEVFARQVNTPAKKAYYDFYTKTIAKKQLEAVSQDQLKDIRKIYHGFGQDIFTPYVEEDSGDRATMRFARRRAKELLTSKGESRESIIRKLGFRNDAENFDAVQAGVPISYTGYKKNHTFDTELMFYKVMDNLIWKKHMDEVHGIGRTIQLLMEKEVSPTTGERLMKNNIDFLISKLEQQVLHRKPAMSKIMQVDRAQADGTVKRLALSVDTAFDFIRRWVTLAVMPLRPVLFIRNTLMENHFNVVRALRGSIGKRTGIKKEFIEYTMSDYLKAMGLMFKASLGGETSKKIKNITEKFHLVTDFNYNFDTSKRVLDNRALREKVLYFTSYVGENFTYKTAALAMMIHDNMWEKYDVNGDYIGGVRGKIKVGDRYEELREYRPEEIRRIREVGKKIHGSYADDQRANVEAYGLGRLFLQFQKYKINYVNRLALRGYNNDALGRYVATGKMDMNDPIFEWENQIDEGVVRTVARWFAMFHKHGLNLGALSVSELRERGFSDIQIQNLHQMGISMAVWMVSVIGLGLLFDPDDDDRNQKNILYKNLLRLKNDMAGPYNPWALVTEAKYPIVGLAFVSDVATTVGQLLAMERYKTTSRRHGYKRGELKATRTFMRRLFPLSSTYRESQTVSYLFGGDVSYEFRFDDIRLDDTGLDWTDTKFIMK